ncbi:thermonuclease family protein [Nocardioides sp.]|uniref:thermonuclease family protein n=1 Tax=Nocardioides sp. TaxID=35761 RepID=UPI00286C479B|nr:thermonuclease family protein [Nocardioides sp.]
MRGHLARLLLVLALGCATLSSVASPSYAADQDCGDFATQAAAQDYFLDKGGPRRDPDRLDSDGDGVACESNPCPCSTAQSGSGTTKPPAKRQRARIVRVLDGDTVVARLTRNGREVTVRLLGIDTPEVFGGVECGGRAASRTTKHLLPRRTRVTLVSDPTQDLRDRYGRLLRYVMKGGVDVDQRLVRRGHARVYVYDGHPFRRVTAYRAAARKARAADLGLWGSC